MKYSLYYMNKTLFAAVLLVGLAAASNAHAMSIKSLLSIKSDLEKEYVDIKTSQGASAATALATSKSLKANAKSKDLTKTVVELQKEVTELKSQQINLYYKSPDRIKVIALQNKLTKLGYAIKADGIFGKGTLDTVKKFQKANGLPETGYVDAKTSSLIWK